jgi:protein phosphatase
MEILLRQPFSFCQLGSRNNQEDARFPDDDAPQDCKPAFIVCDGVGGQDKGEVASRTVADAIGNYMSKVNLTKPFTAQDFQKVLNYAYASLNKQLETVSREMATTLTFVCFHQNGAFCAHMGDSRIYHVRPGVGILYQSEDHSLVNVLVHSGNLTPEEAINHPKSNVITRCMGYVENDSDRPTATTLQIDDIEAGDYFFLCSDGVLHKLDDTELFTILSSDTTDKEKINLIAKESENSSDNNTAYLIGIESVIIDDRDNSLLGDVSQLISNDDTTTRPIAMPTSIAKEITTSSESFYRKIINIFKEFFN